MEATALCGLHLWLEKVGPDRQLLQDALTMLQRHESAVPDPAKAIKAQFLVESRRSPFSTGITPTDRLLNMASRVPWEKERHDCILRAVFQARLREIRKPIYNNEDWIKFLQQQMNYDALDKLMVGLPPAHGPGSNLGAEQWREWIHQLRLRDYSGLTGLPQQLIVESQQLMRGYQLVLAAALFQIDHDNPPAKLDDLVPAYLAGALPDPWSGEPFRYRISKGDEEILYRDIMRTWLRWLPPGQAVIRGSVRPHWLELPVPLWPKPASAPNER